MNARLRKASAEIRRWLEGIGAKIQGVEMTKGDHIRIRFRWRGADHQCVMPQTTSDRRSHHRTKQDLRHQLGLVGRSRKKGRRKPKRKKADKPEEPLGNPPKISSAPDPWDALKGLKRLGD